MPEINVGSILQQAIEHYRPGGAFATTRAEQLRGKERTVTAGMEAGLVGRGLAGTTIGAGIPAAVEQQVSAPWRTETEMMRGGRLMEAVLAKAGFAERAIARRSAEDLARERMDLQRELQDQTISAQERAAKQQRLHEIEMQERAGADAGGGVGGAGDGYTTSAAPSLTGTIRGGPGGGYADPTVGQSILGSEQDYSGWLSSKLAGSKSAYEREYAERPEEHPQYQAGYAAWRKSYGWTD